MMTHKPEATPGPWEAIDGIVYPAAGADDGRDWIADLRCASNENANAALVAAAPELLAALEKIIEGVAGCQRDPQWEAARAAIAKAKGVAA